MLFGGDQIMTLRGAWKGKHRCLLHPYALHSWSLGMNITLVAKWVRQSMESFFYRLGKEVREFCVPPLHHQKVALKKVYVSFEVVSARTKAAALWPIQEAQTLIRLHSEMTLGTAVRLFVE